MIAPTTFDTYMHGRIGVHVSRCVPSPKRICRHSWSSVKLAIFENWPVLQPERPFRDVLREQIPYQRLLVTTLRHVLKRKATVVGWNGVSRRIFLRVYQGRGSKQDHARFLLVERIAHRLAKLPIAKLSGMIKAKRVRARLP